MVFQQVESVGATMSHWHLSSFGGATRRDSWADLALRVMLILNQHRARWKPTTSAQ